MSTNERARLQHISEMSLEEATKECAKYQSYARTKHATVEAHRRKAENAQNGADKWDRLVMACLEQIVAKDKGKVCYHSSSQPHTFMTALEYLNNMA